MFHIFKKPQPLTIEIKECTGQKLAKLPEKKLKENYRYLLSSSKRTLRGYKSSKVVSGKYWDASKEGKIDPDACEVCLENQRAGVIPLDAIFPSGHLYPPAGYLCRCTLAGQTDENA